MPEVPLHCITWSDYSRLTNELAERLTEAIPTVDVIIGITRGGCVVAVSLSHLLPESDFEVISSRVHASNDVRSEKREVTIESTIHLPSLENKNILLVDDVLHSGSTARACVSYIQQGNPHSLTFAALVRDTYEVSCELPNVPLFTAITVHAWVVFPWEPVPEKL